MLVNTAEILAAAKGGRYAIPAPDYVDLDSARAFVSVAEALGRPLILSYAQVLESTIPLDEAAAVGKLLAQRASVPVALHLDHGQDIGFVRRAIELGFTSVMIDASEESFAENVRITKEVVDYAHPRGVTVEAEIGHVGHSGSYANGQTSESIYTTTEEAADFVRQTGVDSLAVSIGTVHGIYKNLEKPQLNFQRLAELSAAVPVPLVLHGGSGSGDDNLHRCAVEGISKINIFTDFLVAAMERVGNDAPTTYLALKQCANDAMAKTLTHYYGIFSNH